MDARTQVALERSNTWQQFGHAFAVGAFILLALGLGLALGTACVAAFGA